MVSILAFLSKFLTAQTDRWTAESTSCLTPCSVLWHVGFFILLCAVFLSLTDTHALQRPLFWRGEEHNWFTNLRACVGWAPLFHFWCGHGGSCCSITTDLPLKNRNFDLSAGIDSEPILLTLLNVQKHIKATRENECGVGRRGPSRHTASLSYNLSYFPAVVADKAKKQG